LRDEIWFCELDWSDSGLGTVAGSFEYSNDLLGSHKEWTAKLLLASQVGSCPTKLSEIASI
jgi:hypothetical protein